MNLFRINRKGTNRIVLLTKNYAFKIPNFLDGLKMFYCGLYQNMTEGLWKDSEHLFPIPKIYNKGFFGFVLVMERCSEISKHEFFHLNKKQFEMFDNLDFQLSNFGKTKLNNIVLLDIN